MTTTETIPVYPRILECGDTEFAFESGGVNFFRMVNPDNLPQERYYKAQDYMAELSSGVDSEFLKAHIAAVQAAVNKGDLGAVAVLTHQLKIRSEWITNIQLLYKYASCIYFAENEDATRYDPQKAAKNIELWQKEKPDAFFLKSRLAQLTPSYEFVKQSLNRFTELQLKQDDLHSQTLMNVLLQLSQSGKATETISLLQSHIESVRTMLTQLQSSEEKA